jgi:hypothetical protein
MSGRENIMAWLTNPNSAYVDQWDADLGNRRWYRRLDRDSATYLYRYDQTNPDASTLFATAADSGAPAALAATAFAVNDNTATNMYDTALALTAELAGALLSTGQSINAVQAAAGQQAGTVNAAVVTATQRRGQITADQTATQRNQLLRQGLRAMIDAAAAVTNWVGLTPAVTAPHRNRLLSGAARINAIATQLYQAAQ